MIALKEMQKALDFKGMSQKMIEQLAEIGEVAHCSRGQYLFHCGDPADTYYIIREGKVMLESEDADGTHYYEKVLPGMGVGCSCLAGLKCYSCHAVADEPCKLLCWSQSALRHLFNQNSRLGYLMIKASAKAMSRRVHRKIGPPKLAYG